MDQHRTSMISTTTMLSLVIYFERIQMNQRCKMNFRRQSDSKVLKNTKGIKLQMWYHHNFLVLRSIYRREISGGRLPLVREIH